MPPNGFNPFDLVEDLKKSGFQQKQAETLAKMLSNREVQSAVTKQDLEATKLELKRDIELVKRDIELVKRDIENVRSELKRDIENVRSELKQDIENVRSELKQDIELVKKDIKELELKIKASQHIQTFQIIGAIAGLLAIFKFLPNFLQ